MKTKYLLLLLAIGVLFIAACKPGTGLAGKAFETGCEHVPVDTCVPELDGKGVHFEITMDGKLYPSTFPNGWCEQDGNSRNQFSCETDPTTGKSTLQKCKVSCGFGEKCAFQTGQCVAVTAPAVCGNKVVESTEQCDDGNTVSGDGCSATCTIETVFCGNGVVEGTEQCDDGNRFNDDSCTNACTCGAGFGFCSGSCVALGSDENNCGSCGNVCLQDPKRIDQRCNNGLCETMSVCGNGVREWGEQCDDKNNVATDGCDTCTLLPGWSCYSSDFPCTTTCGDGIKAGSEVCDDGNRVSGDSCSGGCSVYCDQSGYVACSTSCVNLKTDESNCGACGNLCATGQVCKFLDVGTIACGTY